MSDWLVRQDYIHNVHVEYIDSDGGLRPYLFQGTSEEVSAHVAKSVKNALDSASTHTITLRPVPPHVVVKLGER